METISVVIPVYNAEKTLSTCVKAVLEQTYGDLELILINDGSLDKSGECCDRIAVVDARVRVFHQMNAGVSAARNLGLKKAKGEYITFLDADDIVPQNYLETLYETCREADISICDVVSVCGEKELTRFTHQDAMLNQREALELLLTRRKINSGPCAKLFRRNIVDGLIFPPLKAYEDIIFVRDAFCRAERIAVTNRTEYRYIQNPEGAMSNFFKTPSADIIRASESLLAFIVKRPDLSPETFYITVSHVMQYVQNAIRIPNGREFIHHARAFYRRYILQLLRCPAFPWKEKIVYLLFACGWFYTDGSFTWIGG